MSKRSVRRLRSSRSRRLLAVMIALVALGLLLPGGPAEAFWRRAKEPENVPRRAADRHRYATMVFARGVLRADGWRGWRLDDTTLVLTADSRVDGAGRGVLVDGREALVMGCRRGGAMVVHHATVLEPDRSVARGVTAGRSFTDLPRRAPDRLPR